MTKPEVKNVVVNLKVSTVPGKSNDGAKVRVYYKAFNPSTPEAREAAAVAIEMGMDKNVYTGILDRRWTTQAGDLCITVLAMERIDPRTGKYGFRTFNLDKGQVESVQLLG